MNSKANFRTLWRWHSLLSVKFCCDKITVDFTHTLISRFMGPTWGPSGDDRTQVGHLLAPWNLLSGYLSPSFDWNSYIHTKQLKPWMIWVNQSKSIKKYTNKIKQSKKKEYTCSLSCITYTLLPRWYVFLRSICLKYKTLDRGHNRPLTRGFVGDVVHWKKVVEH